MPHGKGREMKGSKYFKNCSRSAIDQSSPLPMTANWSEDAIGNSDTFYRDLLRHHRNMLFAEDSKSEDNGKENGHEWKIEKNNGGCSHSQKSSSCFKNPRCQFRGSKDSLMDTLLSSGSSRSRSPPSLYPRIVDDSFEDSRLDSDSFDKLHLDLKHCKQYDGLQRSHSGNIDQQPAASPSPSPPQPPCEFNDICASSKNVANIAPDLLRASSFYREALKEATGMEDQQHSSRPLDIDKVAVSAPMKTAGSYAVLENNEDLTTRSSSMSPFYRAALEDATFAEEEELLMLKQHKRNHVDHLTVISAGADVSDKVNRSAIYTPSSFYRSALEEAITSEQVLRIRGERQEHEGNHTINTDVCDTDGPIQQGRGDIMDDDTNLQRDLPIALTASSDDMDRESARERESAMFSFSSSSASSHVDTLATTYVTSPPILFRATTNESKLFQVQRRLSDISFSSSPASRIETETIAPDRRSRSFVDDSYAFSVTRSSAMPHLTSSNLLTTPNVASVHLPGIETGISMGKNTFRGCSKTMPSDSEDDEDLRMAIYLSRVESSAASSLNSEGTVSASLSTKGNRGVPEEESKNDHHSSLSRASCDPTENSEEFLMSQFKAMEECQRNNHKKCSPRNRSSGVTGCSSASPASGESHFQSLRDTSTSSSTTTTSTTTTSSQLSSGGRRQTRRRSQLETRGVSETRKAISNGNSHVVKCKGCSGRLQAPVHYSLVFCPQCQTVSPA